MDTIETAAHARAIRDYQINRTSKPPLRFRGKWLTSSWGSKDLEGIGHTDGVLTLYKTVGTNFVAEMYLFLGTTTRKHILAFVAKSRKALARRIAKKLKDRKFLQALFPADPEYFETID